MPLAGPSPKKGKPDRVIIGYWRTRALGQAIRVMLAHMGIPFEDRQYQVGDPPTFDKKVWKEAKLQLEKNGLEFPNLPYLIDTDGTALSQTRTIMRYLATSRPEHMLMGKNVKQQIQADLVSEVTQEMLDQFCRMTYSNWLEFPVKRVEFISNILPGYLARFDRECSSIFIASTKLGRLCWPVGHPLCS